VPTAWNCLAWVSLLPESQVRVDRPITLNTITGEYR
jgi:hypothetical protein